VSDTIERVRERLNALKKRYERKRVAVGRDLERIEQAPRLMYETELLKTVRTKPYDTFAEVMDYALDPPQRIRIALEAGKTLTQQIEKRFKLARRLQAAEGKALERLQQVEEEGQKLVGIERELSTVAERGERALELFLAAHSDLFAPKPPPRKHEEPVNELPYRAYTSSSGREIWVGKSGAKNDQLTFKHASPHAQWLHASGYAGTHVVVPKKRAEVLDPATLADAALLAAHFSKAPDHIAVEVSVTEVKFVRKFRGANTGQVRIERETHRLVQNDPEAVKAILHRK
jgi:predicted ribosome quality control (RQC) complex YloA/Tae2 family protein